MPLVKVEEIKVIGNVIEEQERIERQKWDEIGVYLNEEVDIKNPICPVCHERMWSELGWYNGFSRDIDEDDLTKGHLLHYDFRCRNYHRTSWDKHVEYKDD